MLNHEVNLQLVSLKTAVKLKLDKAVIVCYSKPDLKVHIYDRLDLFLTFTNAYIYLVIDVSRLLAIEVDRSSWL